MERITTLANRLAEAILFDWDKEEVIKLAKEVAVACHENIEFISLVRRMREAQKREWEIKSKQTCGKELDEHTEVVTKLESEVDEYLKKMEE